MFRYFLRIKNYAVLWNYEYIFDDCHDTFCHLLEYLTVFLIGQEIFNAKYHVLPYAALE